MGDRLGAAAAVCEMLEWCSLSSSWAWILWQPLDCRSGWRLAEPPSLAGCPSKADLVLILMQPEQARIVNSQARS